MSYKSLIFFSLLVLGACRSPTVPFCPHVSYTPPCECIPKKPSPFAPLSAVELKEDFAKELKIGLYFAHECDFYRAITAFKRALVLYTNCSENRDLASAKAPGFNNFAYRREQIEYDILLAHYLSHKYEEVLEYYERSCFAKNLSPSFPLFSDLLIILHDSAKKCCDKPSAKKILECLQRFYPNTAKKLVLSDEIQEGHLSVAAAKTGAPLYLSPLYCCYLKESKSIKKAEILNALLPGAGYWYVDQKNTAFTALLVNGLFTLAAYQFFHRGYVAAGIITTSLELGWYIGGIYGGGRAAAQYNEKKYEEIGRKAMDQGGFYPVLMLNFVF